jgi:hypothetical protein
VEVGTFESKEIRVISKPAKAKKTGARDANAKGASALDCELLSTSLLQIPPRHLSVPSPDSSFLP